jgi:hypothetical protein
MKEYNRKKTKTKRITLFKFSRAEFEAFEREYWNKYNKIT